tara:strand:+ start:265 stop:408 length:144 start_codon:yes stop_codon:yes gene_type:complete
MKTQLVEVIYGSINITSIHAFARENRPKARLPDKKYLVLGSFNPELR